LHGKEEAPQELLPCLPGPLGHGHGRVTTVFEACAPCPAQCALWCPPRFWCPLSRRGCCVLAAVLHLCNARSSQVGKAGWYLVGRSPRAFIPLLLSVIQVPLTTQRAWSHLNSCLDCADAHVPAGTYKQIFLLHTNLPAPVSAPSLASAQQPAAGAGAARAAPPAAVRPPATAGTGNEPTGS
jgi:hypothetical protein